MSLGDTMPDTTGSQEPHASYKIKVPTRVRAASERFGELTFTFSLSVFPERMLQLKHVWTAFNKIPSMLCNLIFLFYLFILVHFAPLLSFLILFTNKIDFFAFLKIKNRETV